ncbi:MAG TPA: glycoside hydrolase family 3 C-terminal domain-containing protein, partial [Acidobacteriaceae bacterium]|nr:glycoside hydrolase family 3 C-terminal domain-containing protein [Acidobacteriaceae bacterium]
HGSVARSIAEQGMVLLKNENGILPLDNTKIRRLALIGPYALGAMTGGGGSSHVIPTYTIDPVDGIAAGLLVQIRPRLNDGCDIAEAVKLAKSSDVAVVMVGDSDTEGSDQPIALSAHQNELVEAVAAANPRTIVVVKSGSAVLLPWIDKVPAVLEAWYPGQEDGNAVADVLFGKVNPSGKLPITFPTSADQTLAADPGRYPGNGTEVHYSEGLDVGYRGYQAHNIKPLFPFGFGLSYTTFEFSGISVQANGEGAVVRFRVANTGSRAGAEVAQLYVTFPSIDEAPEPPHQLKGFQKIELAPGQTRTVELNLSPQQLSYWSESRHVWQLAHGEFSVAVGDSSATTPLQGTFTLR